jgi:hypothetical protein
MIGAILFAAATATIDLSDRTDVRLRWSQGQAPALDIGNAPLLDLVIRDHRWTGVVVYSPSIFVQNVAPPPADPVFLNNLSLVSSWQEHNVHIAISEDGTFGEESTAYLGLQGVQNGTGGIGTGTTTGTGTETGTGTGTGTGMMQAGTGTNNNQLNLLPQNARTILFASSRSTLLTNLQFGKYWLLSLDVGYYIYGGLDDSARQVLPLQRGPFADASVAYTVDVRDRVTANASVSRVEFEQGPCLALELANPTTPMGTLPNCAPDDMIAVATAGWSHSLSRLSTASISIGASAVRSRLNLNPNESYETHVYPAGTLTYQYHVGIDRRPVTLRFDAQLAPTIDNRSGVADNRVEALVTATRNDARVTLTEAAGIARSLGSPLEAPATYVLASSTVMYHLTKLVSLSAEVDYIWQSQEGLGPYSSALAGASLLLHAPVERF